MSTAVNSTVLLSLWVVWPFYAKETMEQSRFSDSFWGMTLVYDHRSWRTSIITTYIYRERERELCNVVYNYIYLYLFKYEFEVDFPITTSIEFGDFPANISHDRGSQAESRSSPSCNDHRLQCQGGFLHLGELNFLLPLAFIGRQV